ncbi:protein Hook homolog 3 [Eurytemora carolleeae]|uniref:protein Hook homolog 3 n=1 Tax=Eurytemora carolleeae TaxID=1294199 RepID=UPI000C76AF54|nr:protein Hook homolog 3 [Eurytemora carolleeae]|eukprot:XP_023335122.1 protein Hook homolog 3-like [Eurytemora affinis]
MGSDKDELYSSLMKWLRTFPIQQQGTEENICEGVSMAQVLNQLAPDHFDTTWLTKVSPVKENKRLRVNNIRKVVGSTVDYLKDVVGMQLTQFPVPDVNQVVNGNKEHIGRLLQLILGVAINCSEQAEYIQRIMEMEEEVQRVVMMAIQELHGVPTQSIHSLPVLEDDIQVKKLMDDMEKTRLEKEGLAQRCHELELRLNLLMEEKSNLSAEFEHLQAQLGSKGTGVLPDSGIRYKELKKENENLKQEMESMEAAKYETQHKVDELTQQLEESEEKLVELQKLAEQSRSLKDEVDILRETSDKVEKYEGIIETYKKKVEEMGDLKRQIKFLEEKNNEYMQNNLDLEDELGKVSKKKPQIEIYKKQINELNTKLSAEVDKADKLAFEHAKLLEKLETLTVERDRIAGEKNALKELNEELKMTAEAGQRSPEYSGDLGDDPDSGMLENIPPSVKERLIRLQRENKRLRAKATGSEGDEVLQTMVEDLKEREEELTKKNRDANKRILELEARLEESSAPPPRVPGSREELELKLLESNKKIASQQEILNKKEVEMAGMEERYKKYIEKAKSVIKTLDPKHNPNSAPEINILRAQLTEKDKVIDELEKESDKAKKLREVEERLMATAFYDFGLKMQRGAVENRLSTLSQGQSFLAKQRQANTRKQNFNQENYDY